MQFNVIFGLNFILDLLKLVISHYHTQEEREIKFKPEIT